MPETPMIRMLLNNIPALRDTYYEFLGGFAEPLLVILDVVSIIVIARLLVALVRKLIKTAIARQVKRGGNEKKLNTVQSVVLNVAVFLVWFFACVAVLNELGLGTTVNSLLATAGIGGLAIGFGAQSLIKDVISGAFLLVEQQISMGDYVTIAGITGTVEEIQLRVTKVRADKGELHIVPNGQIDVVTNFSKGSTTAIVDVPMPYEQDVAHVQKVLEDAVAEYGRDNELLTEAPKVVGIVDLGDSAVMIRVVAKCKSMEHFGVERALRRVVMDAFAAHDIAIPYNKLVVLAHD